MNTSRLALAAAAGTGVQVGAAIVATRFVVHDFGPASLAFLRYAVALLCLLPFVGRRGRVRFAARDLAAILVLGAVQFGLLIALLNLGLRYVSGTRGALLFASFPLLTMLVAAACGRERITAAKSAGVVLTILGIGAALGARSAGGQAGDAWIGVLAVLGAALCGAVCAVLYRPYLLRYPTLPVSALAMAGSVACLAPAAALEGMFRQPAPGWAGCLAVLFIGLSSGIGYVLWLRALKHATPTRVTVFLALSPITAALLGAWLLGERLTSGTLLGITGVLAGLWLASRPTRQPHPAIG